MIQLRSRLSSLLHQKMLAEHSMLVRSGILGGRHLTFPQTRNIRSIWLKLHCLNSSSKLVYVPNPAVDVSIPRCHSLCKTHFLSYLFYLGITQP